MASFLLIDPVDERRAVLKVLLGSQHRLVEHRSLENSLTGCQGESFDAAFVAWPDGTRGLRVSSAQLNWSCARIVLLHGPQGEATEGMAWAREVSARSPIPLVWPVNAKDIANVFNELLGARSEGLLELVGSSPAMQRLRLMAEKVARSNRPLVICGEPGTGKEALARWIHARSARSHGPFETFHCKGLEPAAAFGELFGHEKGAFSWATQARRGLLATADGGSLYLHELGDLDATLQLKVLRLLERPAFGIERLGGQEFRAPDVRLMAGTRLPWRQVCGREVYEELFYRLNDDVLETPSLRTRVEDIAELFQFFVTRSFGAAHQSIRLEASALSALQRYPWPGNLNELDVVVHEAMKAMQMAGNSGAIGSEHLPSHVKAEAQPVNCLTSETPSLPTNPAEPPPGESPPLVVSQPDTGEGGSSRPTPFPESVELDGYRTLRQIRTTRFTRVFLAELKFNGDLVILKLLRPENQEQSNAMRKAISLHRNRPVAERVMIPIHHVNTWSQFYSLVVACLDDSALGGQINQNLYQPYTFEHWLNHKRHPRSRGEIISHLLTMLQVLDFFHHNELVFNDVKPDNFGFYRGELVAIDYGGVTFKGQPPHEFNRAYGPQDKREGTPAEDVFAVVQIMAQALYEPDLQLLAPEHIQGLAAHYGQEYKDKFDKEAWRIIVKGLAPIPPNIRFANARSLSKELEALRDILPKHEQ